MVKLADAAGVRYAVQSVIQMVRCVRTDRDFAIKFFVYGRYFDQDDYILRYLDRYKMGLAAALHFPRRHLVSNTDGAFVDGKGKAMPPCIVTERGESLQLWCQRIKSIAERLYTLHEAGLVHCNLAPCNILRLPHSGQWTFADLTYLAPCQHPKPAFWLSYSAPEVVMGAVYGPIREATWQQDAWSLGVLAVELLMGQEWTPEWDSVFSYVSVSTF